LIGFEEQGRKLMDQDQPEDLYRAMANQRRAFIGNVVPGGQRAIRGVYDDVETEGGARGGVSVRSARVVKIGCQEIYLVETNEGCEVRSSMGTAHLTKADLDLLIGELRTLSEAAEPGA
jgi:hypothetical protein